jgi:Na+-transporting NADH:ubiquinone oxidoreductase subunit A
MLAFKFTIDPINKGSSLVHQSTRCSHYGKLFDEGIFDATRILTVTGSQVNNPKYYKTIVGSSIKNILLRQG